MAAIDIWRWFVDKFTTRPLSNPTNSQVSEENSRLAKPSAWERNPEALSSLRAFHENNLFGSTMKNRVWIESMKFSDGSEIEFGKNDIVVFIGPNNAGKSASLKESAVLLEDLNSRGKVVRSIKILYDGSAESLIEDVKSFSVEHFSNGPEASYRGYGFDLTASSLRFNWKKISDGLSRIFPIFVNVLKTEQRLQAANPPNNINLTSDGISHPIHLLQKYDDLELRFSDYFYQAFGNDLVVHRNAGKEVPLYVGTKPIPKEGQDRVSAEYIADLEKLDLLHEQGDGMRSFVGVLLHSFVTHHSILLIDEPEAFLHPPQARLLGRMLSRDLPSERQLFLATHSQDFLKGLLDVKNSSLKIIRIQREGQVNMVSALTNQDVIEIWNDPLLRHSNVLDGLFHSRVVICESDSDCRFFSAVLASLTDGGKLPPLDILFIHCGGKHRLPVAINALRKLNVPLRVIADFDVLNSAKPLKEIYEGLGGNWDLIVKEWALVKSSIEQKRPELLTSEVKEELKNIMEQESLRVFSQKSIGDIQKVLKKASPWTEPKSVGKAYIPSGDATRAYEKLQVALKQCGLYVLEVGELESFVRSVGNHGPKWVGEVLTKDLGNDPELEVARQFILELVA